MTRIARAAHIVALATLTACGPRELPPPAPAPASVTLGYIHHSPIVPDDAGPVRVELADGELVIEHLAIVVSDIELHACVDEPEATSWLDALVPSARAHVPNSATRLGTPFVEDLISAKGKARVVGEIAPPRGRYCGLYAVVAPADEDVMNLTEVATESIEGASVLVSGKTKRTGDEEWERFEAKASVARAFEVALGPALVLDEKKNSAFLLVDTSLTKSMLATIPLARLTAPEGASELLEHLAGTLAVFPRRDTP